MLVHLCRMPNSFAIYEICLLCLARFGADQEKALICRCPLPPSCQTTRLIIVIWMLQRTSGEAGVRLQLVRANEAQAERHEQEQRQMQLEAIHDAAGKYSLVTTNLLLKRFN